MNTSSQPIDPGADERAALWAARLDGSVLSASDRVALDTWLAEHPAHRTLLSNYCQFSADLEQHLPALVESGAVKMPDASPASRRPGRFWWIGGSSLAAATLALAFWFNSPTTQSTDFSTAVAQRHALTLADGTRVELNAHTTLRVDLVRDERRVRLASGQAFFAVSHDPSRPFIVETPSGSVRVTGTSFDVRTENADSLEVTVVEGSVQVRPGQTATPVTLAPHDRLLASAENVSMQALSPSALAAALAWRQGQIVFDGTPLREALAHFARFHGRALTAAPDTAAFRIGGRFSLDDLDGFLAALEDIHPVKVMRNLDGAIQVSLRTAP